jgi:hypothetical protein
MIIKPRRIYFGFQNSIFINIQEFKLKLIDYKISY